MAKKLQCAKLIVALNSSTLASSLTNAVVPDNNLLIMCRDLLQKMGNTRVRHEDERFNEAADTLPKESRKKEVHQFLKNGQFHLYLFVRLLQ